MNSINLYCFSNFIFLREFSENIFCFGQHRFGCYIVTVKIWLSQNNLHSFNKTFVDLTQILLNQKKIWVLVELTKFCCFQINEILLLCDPKIFLSICLRHFYMNTRRNSIFIIEKSVKLYNRDHNTNVLFEVVALSVCNRKVQAQFLLPEFYLLPFFVLRLNIKFILIRPKYSFLTISFIWKNSGFNLHYFWHKSRIYIQDVYYCYYVLDGA